MKKKNLDEVSSLFSKETLDTMELGQIMGGVNQNANGDINCSISSFSVVTSTRDDLCSGCNQPHSSCLC